MTRLELIPVMGVSDVRSGKSFIKGLPGVDLISVVGVSDVRRLSSFHERMTGVEFPQ